MDKFSILLSANQRCEKKRLLMLEQHHGATKCLHVLWKKNNCICIQCCQLVTSVVRNNV